jgi:D-alanine-D-alanine ligase
LAITSKKIGVLFGGASTEREISRESGRAIEASLRRQGCSVASIDVDRNVAGRIREEAVGLAVIALHGRWGEDGAIQGLLEIMGIPYTGSGILASAIGMNKVMTKQLLDRWELPTPKYAVFRASEAPSGLPEGFSAPVVIKPAGQGSTVGVSVVERGEGAAEAFREAAKYDPSILLEEYISGREITAGILGGEPLPLVEIVPKGGFYDYQAKYTKGMTEYVVPARLSGSETETIQRLAAGMYRGLGCEGCARVDFRVTQDGRPYILEINTVPGMTETSLLPKAAQAAGLDYDALVRRMVEMALNREGDGA